MDVKKLALLVGALVIAVVTAVMAKNMFAGAGAQQAAAAAPAVPVGPKVLVAKKALPVGTIIDADSFTYQPWPKELMQSAYYMRRRSRREPADADRHRRPLSDHGRPAGHPRLARRPAGSRLPRRGARPRHARSHRSGELVDRRRRLRLPGRPRRPGADPAGRRRRRWSGRSRSPRRSFATSACSRPTSASPTRTRTARPRSRPSSNVTLEVTPKIAEKIAVAQSFGTLSLSLRSIADNSAELERAVAAGDVKVPANANPAQEKQMLLAVANRPIDTNTDLHDRRRRVALPAPHRARQADGSMAAPAGCTPVQPVPACSALDQRRASASLAAMMSPCSGGSSLK